MGMDAEAAEFVPGLTTPLTLQSYANHLLPVPSLDSQAPAFHSSSALLLHSEVGVFQPMGTQDQAVQSTTSETR